MSEVRSAPVYASFGTGERLFAPGGIEIGTGSLFGKILSVVTAPITAPIKAIAKVTSKIPVIGDVTHIVNEAVAAPANIAISVASGERLDHVAVDALKAQLKIVKDVAPYAQTVVSFVPGIGTGVAAAIGAGAALAEGQSITQAAKAAIRGAIPGGAVAQAGFDVATKIASGENIAKAALESARNLLPSDIAKKAFDIGLAVATGEKIQTALANGLVSIAPGQLQSVLQAGAKALASTPGLAEAVKSIAPGAATEGFNLAAGLLSHAGVNEKSLTEVRSKLPPEVIQGFDAALKTQIPHTAWLNNVVSAPLPAANAWVQGAFTSLAKKAPAPPVPQMPAVKPPVPKMPEPVKAAPKAPSMPAPKVPTMPAPKAPTPVAAKAPAAPAAAAPRVATPTQYAPYPQASGTVHGAPSSYVPYGMLSGPPPTCRSLSAPISDMGHGMRRAGLSAVHGSRGAPRMVRGPDGKDYHFELKNGTLTARQCVT